MFKQEITNKNPTYQDGDHSPLDPLAFLRQDTFLAHQENIFHTGPYIP